MGPRIWQNMINL